MSDGALLKWNIMLSALAAGRTAKLDHMDVLEASRDQIVAGDRESGRVYMVFNSADIAKPGVPQLTHFEVRYFDDRGNELRKRHTAAPTGERHE